jgi:hypothetical protein
MQMNNEKSVREERPVLSTITSLQTYVGPLWSLLRLLSLLLVLLCVISPLAPRTYGSTTSRSAVPLLPLALAVSVRVAQKFEIQMRDALSCPLTEGGGDAVHVACC